ncbi:MAG: phosphopentomutase [Spirochaetales bacterium]
MRAFLLVIDSFGIGELGDAAQYGDVGSNTALHIAQAVGGARWPNLQALGLGNAAELLGFSLPGCPAALHPGGCWGVMEEVSPGKDTTTGHWELAGFQLEEAFPVFRPDFPSFPPELLHRLTAVSGLEFLGNCAASGTQVIEDFGAEHLRTGKPIVYTSSDSVFQIAAHEDVLSQVELYELCAKARVICNDWTVGRVIARPFRGTPGAFERTSGRHDYSYQLPGPSIIDHLASFGVETIAVGKISDIFNGQGFSQSYPDKGNPACLARTVELVRAPTAKSQLVFVNLVDTDMIYGHRRDPKGYHDCVAQTDEVLGELLPLLRDDDVLMITADHGCDPTYRGSDHTREHVPLLLWSRKQAPRSLGIRSSFADVAQSLAKAFGAADYPSAHSPRGKSFWV